MRKTKQLWFGSKTRTSITAVVLIALITSTSAFALWAFTTKSGAAAKVGANTATVTVSPAATPAADLYPGATVGLKVDVTNANPTAVTLTDIGVGTVSPGDIVVSGSDGACPSSNFTQAWAAQIGLSVAIPVCTTTITLPGNTLSMSAAAPVGFKNARVVVNAAGGNGYYLTFR
jgi:hypothetical protein